MARVIVNDGEEPTPKPRTRVAKKAAAQPQRKSVLDEGLFKMDEVDLRCITVRWDALHDTLVIDTGGIDSVTAQAWLAFAASSVYDHVPDAIVEDSTRERRALRRRP